jgi:hypothetical protein
VRRHRSDSDAEVLSGREFLELCRYADKHGAWIPAVDVVGPAGYRIARVIRKKRVKLKADQSIQNEFTF